MRLTVSLHEPVDEARKLKITEAAATYHRVNGADYRRNLPMGRDALAPSGGVRQLWRLRGPASVQHLLERISV
jgi:hypothetical protein